VKPKATLWQKIRRTALLLIGIYLLAVLALTLSQRRLIYYPTRFKAEVGERWGVGSELDPWKNSAGEIIGWKRLSKTPATGQVLIVHGNAGCAIDRAPYADALQKAAPFDVYILEYPGYGSRSGSPSESSIFAAANEGIGLLGTNRPIYLIGESLGTGVAAYLAGTHAIAGVLLIAPYNNFATVAQEHMPLFPVKWILRDRYPSDTYLKTYNGPLVVLLAGNDRVVPNHLGRRLFDDYRGPKKLLEQPNATHDDIHMIKPAVWTEITTFWRNGAETKS